MARTKREVALRPAPELADTVSEDLEAADALAARQADAALAREQRLALVAQQLGQDARYDRGAVAARLSQLAVLGGQLVLEVGRLLLWAKENELPADFHALLEQSGMEPRAARRLMQAALKFSALSGPKTPVLLSLPHSKLFELMTMEDEDLAALADGETIAGLQVDELDGLTCRELRQRLRGAEQEHAEELEAVRAVAQRDREARAEAEERLERLERGKVPASERIPPILDDLEKHSRAAEGQLRALGLVLDGLDLVAEAEEERPDRERDTKSIVQAGRRLRDCLERLASHVGEIQAQFELRIDPLLAGHEGFLPQTGAAE